ncbi:MAG TPA: ABC transporter permease, partial [Gemmataceae bacterium]|nr:ABC transporter permease [Gemmataceae bacterium]
MSSGANPLPSTAPAGASRVVNGIVGWISTLGGLVFDQFVALGDVALFGLRTLRWLVTSRPLQGTLLPSFYQIGVLSLPVVALTGTFIGMVLAEQSYAQFRFFHLE